MPLTTTIMFGERKIKTIRSKYRGYCSKCHYTIWQREEILYDGRAKHVDCVEAIKDPTPREVDPRYLTVMGKINKKKFLKNLESRS